MSCNNKITAAITNSCHPVKGFKKLYAYNRSEFNSSKIDNEFSIAKIGGYSKLYLIDGYKGFANGGHDGKAFEDAPMGYSQKMTLSLTTGTAAQQAQVDRMDDIVFIGIGNDGVIYGYGVNNGLWKSSQTQKQNDNNGKISVEFATMEGTEEPYSTWFCTQTEAQLDALTV